MASSEDYWGTRLNERLLTARLHIMMFNSALVKDGNYDSPDGWRFTDPDTGLEIEAKSYESLVERVLDHRVTKDFA